MYVSMPLNLISLFLVFFFQAEDGIRDTSVTGVQTCALPIWNGLMIEPRIIDLAGFVCIDADPMHLAAACNLLLADYGNVVFRLAGNRACAATDAGAKIDNHSPCVSAVLKLIRIVERFVRWRFFFRSSDASRIGNKLSQRPAAQKVAAFHRVMT